jgi:hypothetical protein
MCGYKEWERLTRRVQQTVDEGQLREFVADAATRMEALADELRSWACAPKESDWVRGCGQRSRTEWVA